MFFALSGEPYRSDAAYDRFAAVGLLPKVSPIISNDAFRETVIPYSRCCTSASTSHVRLHHGKQLEAAVDPILVDHPPAEILLNTDKQARTSYRTQIPCNHRR